MRIAEWKAEGKKLRIADCAESRGPALAGCHALFFCLDKEGEIDTIEINLLVLKYNCKYDN
jgi:hypothetical protein